VHFPLRLLLISTALTSLLTSAVGKASGQLQFRTVARSGQTAPGSGATFSGFDGPVIDNAGQTAFIATLSGAGVDSTNQTGIWSESSGSLSLLARKGSSAPGAGAGTNFNSFNSPLVQVAGRTAFRAGLTAGSFNNQGIWSGSPGNLLMVARNGQEPPNTGSGVAFDNFSLPVLNDGGQTAFNCSLSGAVNSTNDVGIWSSGSGTLSLVARKGAHAPGTEAGANFDFLTPPALSRAGKTAFQATLTGVGVDVTNNQGIWSEGSGTLTLVARKGSPAPGTSTGVNFNSLNVPVINREGRTAFHASLTSTSGDGIWSESSGTLSLIARTGFAANGLGSGITFSSFGNVPALNDLGQTAFRAFLAGPGVNSLNDGSVWREDSGVLSLIVREGAPAPGTATGVTFSDFNFTFPILNNASQIAFSGTLTGTTINSTNDTGLWVTNPAGQLMLIAREGDLFEVAPGDLRIISSLSLVTSSGGQDGRSSSFNDFGQLAFLANFTNGSSGVFVATVPEPSTLAFMALGALLAYRKERRPPLKICQRG